VTAPLRYPAYRYLVVGRVISMLGNSIAPIALAFAVLDLTGAASDLGLVVAARSITNVVFVLFGGVIADRFPRQVVMVVSGALSFLTQGTIAVLVLTGSATVPLLAGIAAVNGIVSAFVFPASAALIAQTVPAEIRRSANAINRLGINAASIGGAAFGGVLVSWINPGWGIAIDALTFAVGALLFSFIRVPRVAAEASGDSMLSDLATGFREFIANTWVWIVVACAAVTNMVFSGGDGVLGPVVAQRTFGRPAWGFIAAVWTAGMLVGAFVALRAKPRRPLLVGVWSILGLPALLLALGMWPYVWVLMPVAFLAGVGLEQFGVAWETSMQDHIPADKLARVYSYDALGSFIAVPVGELLAGPLADRLGLGHALVVLSVVGFASVLAMLASRSVRQLERRPAPVISTVEAVA
jgi:MFS family permease